MPIYEYRCGACATRFELLRRVGQDKDGISCPRCGQFEVEKEFSTFAGSVSSGAAASGGGCSPSGRFT